MFHADRIAHAHPFLILAGADSCSPLSLVPCARCIIIA
jgi:hypothetical protein